MQEDSATPLTTGTRPATALMDASMIVRFSPAVSD